MFEEKVYKNSKWNKVGAKKVLEGTLVTASIGAGNSGDVYKISSPDPGIYYVTGQIRVPFTASHNGMFPQIQLRAGATTVAYTTPYIPSGTDTIIMNISTIMTDPSDIRVGVYAPVAFSNMSGHLKAVRV